MQALLASTPDKNRRSIEYSDGHHLHEIARINQDMNEFTAENQADLAEVMRLLKKLGAAPSPWIMKVNN